ncbi:MAG: hypothetical protein M1831_001955 [Alyxoria varia]|nr:MAG: hypothetical protein M1831_001955 [Alyxoria varia]
MAQSSPKQWSQSVGSTVALDAAGLIALAELPTLALRTALTGSASFVDILVLCPGIHRQQEATSLNAGEYPITANMTSGYVFRVENQGTVAFLQRIGRTGHLTTMSVKKDTGATRGCQAILDLSGPPSAVLLYLATILLTLCALTALVVVNDGWGLGIFGMLIFARLLNVLVIRRRCDANWHGKKEAGGSRLLILLSQDRWMQIHGLTNDVKRITSGQWLRERTFLETSLEGLSIVLVYLSAALASNSSQVGKIIILVLFMVNAGLLTLSNETQDALHMKGLILKEDGMPKSYDRRLSMADELIKENGDKDDWATKIGLINKSSERVMAETRKEVIKSKSQENDAVQV